VHKESNDTGMEPAASCLLFVEFLKKPHLKHKKPHTKAGPGFFIMKVTLWLLARGTHL
jgi:hypothetical protein